MYPRISSLSFGGGLCLLVSFDDGTRVRYDVAEDVEQIPDFAPLASIPALFGQARVDSSRTCVYWNDRIDLPADVIYEYGTRL